MGNCKSGAERDRKIKAGKYDQYTGSGLYWLIKKKEREEEEEVEEEEEEEGDEEAE